MWPESRKTAAIIRIPIELRKANIVVNEYQKPNRAKVRFPVAGAIGPLELTSLVKVPTWFLAYRSQ